MDSGKVSVKGKKIEKRSFKFNSDVRLTVFCNGNQKTVFCNGNQSVTHFLYIKNIITGKQTHISPPKQDLQ